MFGHAAVRQTLSAGLAALLFTERLWYTTIYQLVALPVQADCHYSGNEVGK